MVAWMLTVFSHFCWSRGVMRRLSRRLMGERGNFSKRNVSLYWQYEEDTSLVFELWFLQMRELLRN